MGRFRKVMNSQLCGVVDGFCNEQVNYLPHSVFANVCDVPFCERLPEALRLAEMLSLRKET